MLTHRIADQFSGTGAGGNEPPPPIWIRDDGSSKNANQAFERRGVSIAGFEAAALFGYEIGDEFAAVDSQMHEVISCLTCEQILRRSNA